MKLVIIDYGMGNMKSISSAFKYLGVDEIVTSDKYKDIKQTKSGNTLKDLCKLNYGTDLYKFISSKTPSEWNALEPKHNVPLS